MAVVLPAVSALAAARVPGTGPPTTGSGLNTAAALDNPQCDKDAGPYGRLDFVLKGFGPACVVAWKSGQDNGGATYQGVTKDTIKVVSLVPNEQQMAEVTPTQRPVNYATGEEGTVTAVLKDGLAGFEHGLGKTYTYGRDVEMEFVTSSGSDEAAQRVDVVTVKAMKPFVVLDNATTALDVFDAAMVAAKIPVFSLYVTVDQTLKQAPYRWGQQDPIAGSMNAAEFIGKQLQGKKAQYAGDAAMHKTTRKFGVVRSSVLDIGYFDDTLSKYGVKIAPNAVITYPGTTSTTGDASVAQEQAPVAITKLKSAGVTTVILLADGQMTGAMTKQATAQDYHPEWIYPGSFNNDFPVLAARLLRHGPVGARVRHLERLARFPDRADDPAQCGPVVLGAEPGHLPDHLHQRALVAVLRDPVRGSEADPADAQAGVLLGARRRRLRRSQPGDRQAGSALGVRPHQRSPVRGVHARQQGLRADLVGLEHRGAAVARFSWWQGHRLVPRQREALLRRPLAHQADEVLRQEELDLPVRFARGAAPGRAVHRLPERDGTRITFVVVIDRRPSPVACTGAILTANRRPTELV